MIQIKRSGFQLGPFQGIKKVMTASQAVRHLAFWPKVIWTMRQNGAKRPPLGVVRAIAAPVCR
ncbi:hypothetical protein [Pannonibacter phragmitetus]|uniref:hypothetical protein n=1 Tax=Pannonibacter phragmitetus TaxID=121719 RepID=UPI000AE8448D|nr:hypothetical protein [Pannonibacter phragmitetus]